MEAGGREDSRLGKMSRFLLSKATSSSESPTPGYMYNEIADLTLQGSTEKVLKFLSARLKKQNPQVGKGRENEGVVVVSCMIGLVVGLGRLRGFQIILLMLS